MDQVVNRLYGLNENEPKETQEIHIIFIQIES